MLKRMSLLLSSSESVLARSVPSLGFKALNTSSREQLECWKKGCEKAEPCVVGNAWTACYEEVSTHENHKKKTFTSQVATETADSKGSLAWCQRNLNQVNSPMSTTSSVLLQSFLKLAGQGHRWRSTAWSPRKGCGLGECGTTRECKSLDVQSLLRSSHHRLFSPPSLPPPAIFNIHDKYVRSEAKIAKGNVLTTVDIKGKTTRSLDQQPGSAAYWIVSVLSSFHLACLSHKPGAAAQRSSFLDSELQLQLR